MTAELDPRNNNATDTPYDAQSAEQHIHETLQNTDTQDQPDK